MFYLLHDENTYEIYYDLKISYYIFVIIFFFDYLNLMIHIMDLIVNLIDLSFFYFLN